MPKCGSCSPALLFAASLALDLTIGIAGSGGDGVILLGELLARASARMGLHCTLVKSFGPQIRGGESSCRVRLSTQEVLNPGGALWLRKRPV